jgi:uncharacterized protein (TIGR00645 family)
MEHSESIQEDSNKVENFFQTLVLSGRYLIIPMYLGLTVGMVLYDITFFKELCHLFIHPFDNAPEILMLGFLGLVDMTMIANLILTTTIGGYSIFVHEIRTNGNKRMPRFLHHLTSGSLKIKMGGSLVGVSSIHLLTSFINVSNVSVADLTKQLVIHFSFIISALVMAKIETMCHPPELEKE